MVEGRSVYRQFYEDVIGVGKGIVEIRIQHLQKDYMFSKYVTNFKELLSIFKYYNNYPFNIYFGIHQRKKEGKKDNDIDERRIFYIDIEREGKKPNLNENKEYQMQIERTVEYICNKMEQEFNFRPCALIQSGRGNHLYYLHEPLFREQYDKKFKYWWKEVVIPMLNKNKPIEEIKFDDSMFNISRIASAPGTNHNKYPEKPFRKIIKYAPNNVNNLKVILDKVELPVYNPKVIKKINKKKILEEPVFQILKLGVPMNVGMGVNNILMFSASLLCRDGGLDAEEIEQINNKLIEWGYWAGILIPSEEYNYNSKTISNWCCKNMNWCLEKNYKLPYPLMKINYKYEINNDSNVDYKDEKIETIWQVLEYCAKFNQKFCYKNRDTIVFYKPALIKHLELNCTQQLQKFLTLNNLWNIVGLYRGDKQTIYL